MLCSTTITYISDQGKKEHGIGLAFFYFQFDDVSKQSDTALIKALLLQLSSQCPAGDAILEKLYKSSQPDEPTTSTYLDFLRQLVERFYQVYIVLDAVNEVPRNHGRDKVLKVLKQIRSWELAHMHVLVTSQDEADIRQCMHDAAGEKITLAEEQNRLDIRSYIGSQLTDDGFKMWGKHHDTIVDRLASRAQGM